MRIDRAVLDRLPATPPIAFSASCRTRCAVARGPPAVRPAGVVRGRCGARCRHRRPYDTCLYAGGGQSRVDLPFISWIVIVPPVSLIQLVPVSLAGWGVRELGFVVVLAGFGIPAETALAASL